MMLGVLILLNLINTFIVFSFMNIMYKRVYSDKIIYIVAFVMFCLLHIEVNSYRITIVNILFTIVIIQVLGKIMYADIPKKMVYNLLFALYLIFVDTAVFAIVSLVLELPLSYLTFSEHYVGISAIIQYAFVLCTYKVLIRRFFKEREGIRLQQNTFFFLLALFEIGIIGYMWNVKTQIGTMFLLILCLGFIAIDMCLIYLFEIGRKHDLLKHEMNLTKQQSMLLHQHIKDAQKSNEQTKKFIHDMKGQLNIVESLYGEEGAQTSAKNLKAQVELKLNELDDQFHCTDAILNVIINNRIKAAKAQGISATFIVQADIDWSFMREIHMTSLLPNLLNNAVEACAQMTTGEKFIDCRIQKIHGNIVIRIQNSYSPACLLLKSGKYNTTKEGHFGVGLSNVREIIERYNGSITITTKDAVFTVGAYLSTFPINKSHDEI